ncbi:MAG: hypothetical protein WAV54_05510 [Acidimicrobiales bacterium]
MSGSPGTSGALGHNHPPRTRRPYHTVVLALMVATSTVATFDLYLFASSGFH